MPSQLTCIGTVPHAQGSAPGPPAAHGPVLGYWPIIVRVDLTALLKTIKKELPLGLLLEVAHDQLKVKLDKDTKGDIDITSGTDNEEIVQRFCDELKELLGIRADSRCTLAAGVLKINTQGAIGVYTQSRLTKAHGHFMGVLNLLIGGTKMWKLWKPGPHPREHQRVEDACINQREGELLWLPPGWYHEVLTTGISYMTSTPFRYVNTQNGVAHSMTCWHVPAELRTQTVLTYALGMSEEAQTQVPYWSKGVSHSGAADVKQKLYDIFVDKPVEMS